MSVVSCCVVSSFSDLNTGDFKTDRQADRQMDLASSSLFMLHSVVSVDIQYAQNDVSEQTAYVQLMLKFSAS